jgi:ABC-type nickel/cobalt efflux system permease component RcnA
MRRFRMGMLVRHLASIAALPFVVTVVVPVWLARRNNISLKLGTTVLQIAAQNAGVLLIAFGLFLFASSLRRFATEGEGTLAPCEPENQAQTARPSRRPTASQSSHLSAHLSGMESA